MKNYFISNCECVFLVANVDFISIFLSHCSGEKNTHIGLSPTYAAMKTTSAIWIQLYIRYECIKSKQYRMVKDHDTLSAFQELSTMHRFNIYLNNNDLKRQNWKKKIISKTIWLPLNYLTNGIHFMIFVPVNSSYLDTYAFIRKM